MQQVGNYLTIGQGFSRGPGSSEAGARPCSASLCVLILNPFLGQRYSAPLPEHVRPEVQESHFISHCH